MKRKKETRGVKPGTIRGPYKKKREKMDFQEIKIPEDRWYGDTTFRKTVTFSLIGFLILFAGFLFAVILR
jgi:hypothetical protein